jgi:hypothetical protein
MASRRFLLLSVVVVLVLVQGIVFLAWARPKVFKFQSHANVMRSLSSDHKQLALFDIAAEISSPPTEQLSPHVINTSTLSHLFHAGGSTWKRGSFCEDFFQRRYHTPVEVCRKGSQIRCFWNPENAHAATCDMHQIMIRPQKLWKAMENVEGSFPHSGAVGLLRGPDNNCGKSTINNLARTMEGGDYVKWFVDDLISNPALPKESCQHWINETAFLFSSQSHHIYFRFLAYYSIHKSLIDHHVEPGSYRIFRLTEGYNYIFAEYERALFPGVVPITDLPDGNVCFRKAVLVPKCYATILFQCKMQYEIRDKCLACDGRGLTGTSLRSFRTRVLAACSIEDTPKRKSDPKLITVILREPYTRWAGDHPSHFERVLTNSIELVAGLEKSFPDCIVKPIHMEELSACEQIGYTHDADFLVGVHGAGLVHLWWLREEAVVIELEPYFEMGNPSFKTLAKLTGRRYVGLPIEGSSGGVRVNVNSIIEQIKSHS